MSTDTPRFLPDRLRPQATRRRSRRGLMMLSVVPVMLLALPQWRISDVQVDGCPKLPASTVRSLHELVGQPTLDLDLEAVRDRVEVWPGVGDVQVELELPGTLVVRAEAAPVRGSVRVGRSWHGVGRDGDLAGTVDIAVPPVLEAFAGDLDRRRALIVAQRMEEASQARVLSIRRITPADYRVTMLPAGAEEEKVVHVHPRGSLAESAWCAALTRGRVPQAWADLRWADRMVIGGGQ